MNYEIFIKLIKLYNQCIIKIRNTFALLVADTHKLKIRSLMFVKKILYRLLK